MLSLRLNQPLTSLFSSADVIAPMQCSDAPPVQPVLKAWLLCILHRLWNIVHWMYRCSSWRRRFNRCNWDFLTWLSCLTKLHWCIGRRIFRQLSDAPMLRQRLNRCYWFQKNSSNSAFLWVLFLCFSLYGLFTLSLGSRNVHSTKPLVPLIALSFDHQNHSKWHKWCHVRYTEFYPNNMIWWNLICNLTIILMMWDKMIASKAWWILLTSH